MKKDLQEKSEFLNSLYPEATEGEKMSLLGQLLIAEAIAHVDETLMKFLPSVG